MSKRVSLILGSNFKIPSWEEELKEFVQFFAKAKCTLTFFPTKCSFSWPHVTYKLSELWGNGKTDLTERHRNHLLSVYWALMGTYFYESTASGRGALLPRSAGPLSKLCSSPPPAPTSHSKPGTRQHRGIKQDLWQYGHDIHCMCWTHMLME